MFDGYSIIGQACLYFVTFLVLTYIVWSILYLISEYHEIIFWWFYLKLIYIFDPLRKSIKALKDDEPRVCPSFAEESLFEDTKLQRLNFKEVIKNG